MCSTPNSEVPKEFKTAFKQLDQLEKAKFYLMNVRNVQKALKELVPPGNKKLDEDDKKLPRESTVYTTTQYKVLLKGG